MGQQTILIIDDEPLVLIFLSRLFTGRYNVFTASSIEQGKMLFDSSDEVDLVLVDYLIGKATGLEFLNEVRINKPHVKRILMSGKLEPETITNTFNNEIAHRIITKPWNNVELLEIVHQVLCQTSKPGLMVSNQEKSVLFSGSLRGISVDDIICLLTANNKNGILLLKEDGFPDAKIYLSSGRIVDAVAAGVSGSHVAEDLLHRTSGSFCFLESNKFDTTSENIPLDQQILVI